MIYYDSTTQDEAQENYIDTEKELIAAVYAMEKLRLCPTIIVYINHFTLKHLLDTKDVKPRLIRWILLL